MSEANLRPVSYGEVKPNVVVIHDTNGPKYFEALIDLSAKGRIGKVSFYETSVAWKFLYSVLREKRSVFKAFKQSLSSLSLRLMIWNMRDSTVILGMAPWDFRFPFLALLRHRNRLIYHTSWPFWEGPAFPNGLGIFTPIIRHHWSRLLASQQIEVVAVTSAASKSFHEAFPMVPKPSVISHVVSNPFFTSRAVHREPFRVVFVGRLVASKGVSFFKEILRRFEHSPIELEIVGDGPLRPAVLELALQGKCRYRGAVSSRSALAAILADCQCLISPAVRNEKWEELFGISIVEAMACGLPCIVTNHVGPRSIITPGHDGILVPEGALDEIERWILKLLVDAEFWNSISDAARTTAKRYSLSSIEENWEALLRKKPQ